MDKHINSRYDEELQNLQNMVMEMSRLCESQLHAISKYIRRENDSSILEDIEGIDDRINQYHMDINKESIRLIAKRAPVAVDLRLITTTFNIVNDLERIGDECCKIARSLKKEQIDPDTRIWKEIRPATRLAKNLLTRTIDMLARGDVEVAYVLLKDDDELDVNYNNAIRVITSYMLENTSMISASIDILMAAKSLERIGDHCINIAESIIFAQEGEDVRYHQLDRDIRASSR